MSDAIVTLYSRLVCVSLLVCVAVMLFIMCSDAARVSPITTYMDPGVKRSVFTPHSQHHALSTGFLSTETRRQSGSTAETEMRGNSAEALSVTELQSNPNQFTGHHFIYSQNNLDNGQAQGHTVGGARPAVSSTLTTSPFLHRKPQSRLSSYPLIIRKSSQKEASSPFRQSSSFSQVRDHRDAQKSYNEAPTNASPELAAHKTARPLKAGEYWSASLPALRGHYSGHKETNELSAVRVPSTSGGIQSSKFPGFASQTVSRAPSISLSLDASVIKRNPSPEKLTSSITDSSQGLSSLTASKALRLKKVQSYLFKDSQTSLNTGDGDDTVAGGRRQTSGLTGSLITMPLKHRPSDVGLQLHSRHASDFKLIHRQAPTREDDVNLNTTAAQTASSSHHLSPVQLSLHPASGKKESFVPVSHAASQDNYATSSERSVNATAGGSVHGYKLGRSTKSIYGVRGFENLLKEQPPPSSSRRTHSQPYSFNKGKDYKFKIPHIHQSLSPKYSFSQRGGSSLTPKPAKLERTPTDYPPPPSSSYSDLVQTTTVSAPKPFTSGFKDVQPLLPESDLGMERKPDHREVKTYQRLYSLRGFGTRPLEGAKTSVRKPDALHQGSELRSSQIWQPKSSRWSDQTGETEPETISAPTQTQNEQSNADTESLLKPEGSSESAEGSRFTPEKHKKNRKIYTFLGFQSVHDRIGNAPKKTRWNYTGRDPTAASPAAHRVSSAQFRSAGGLSVESSSASEPRTPNNNTSKPVAMKTSLLSGSTSSTVRGRRVKGKHINSRKLDQSTPLAGGGAVNAAIVRLPARPARVKAVTYADVLGSASFSSVRATPLTPTTPADEGYFPNATATTQQTEGAGYWTSNPDDGGQSRGNTSTSPGANAEDEAEGFNSAEEKKLSFQSRENDTGVEVDFDAFVDNEESGSGAFDLSDVFSNATKVSWSQKLSEDLLELDYLRLSTENISFKSVKLSHTEK